MQDENYNELHYIFHSDVYESIIDIRRLKIICIIFNDTGYIYQNYFLICHFIWNNDWTGHNIIAAQGRIHKKVLELLRQWVANEVFFWLNTMTWYYPMEMEQVKFLAWSHIGAARLHRKATFISTDNMRNMWDLLNRIAFCYFCI